MLRPRPKRSVAARRRPTRSSACTASRPRRLASLAPPRPAPPSLVSAAATTAGLGLRPRPPRVPRRVGVRGAAGGVLGGRLVAVRAEITVGEVDDRHRRLLDLRLGARAPPSRRQRLRRPIRLRLEAGVFRLRPRPPRVPRRVRLRGAAGVSPSAPSAAGSLSLSASGSAAVTASAAAAAAGLRERDRRGAGFSAASASGSTAAASSALFAAGGRRVRFAGAGFGFSATGASSASSACSTPPRSARASSLCSTPPRPLRAPSWGAWRASASRPPPRR